MIVYLAYFILCTRHRFLSPSSFSQADKVKCDAAVQAGPAGCFLIREASRLDADGNVLYVRNVQKSTKKISKQCCCFLVHCRCVLINILYVRKVDYLI